MNYEQQKEAFQEAFKLVKNPNTWCQDSSAVDASGKECHPLDDEAMRFCSIGALRRACKTANTWLTGVIYDRLTFGLPTGLGCFNDTSSHSEVIAHWEKVGRENGWL